jgi:pyruvate/2-oxoglutarate dehydrogenase complex dihydrolipoamide dehydrogenase (E3) component
MSDSQFDLVVIGRGPARQKGAIAAAKRRKRVAVIDRTLMIGGVCMQTGTIPSTIRFLHVGGLIPALCVIVKNGTNPPNAKKAWDPHLRSTHDVSGRHIQAVDGRDWSRRRFYGR